ncbi:MAG: uroporphyrinogen decarboxylase family protein [Victivallales bacterium]
MNGRQRFAEVMGYGKPDRIPVLYFGTWPETKLRWKEEGFKGVLMEGDNAGPQLPEMDADWESSPDGKGSIWNNQGILEPWPHPKGKSETIEEDAETRTMRTPFGGIVQVSKIGSSISHTIKHDLEPTRESWAAYKKSLDPSDKSRWRPGWEERVKLLNSREHMTCFFGGSLFGNLRNALGVEAISYLPFDDSALYEEMIEFQTEYYMALNKPLLEKASFDFAYIFEDCCFNTGPLLSPDLYRTYFDRRYRRMIDFYHRMGVKYVLIDSDGKIDDLLPLWLESGFDIVFPIEVGTWKANPVTFRKKYGKQLRMIGGVDKHVIPLGEKAIRAELEPLKELVAEGAFIPMPDHRIPPDCPLDQFRTYIRLFKEIFNS